MLTTIRQGFRRLGRRLRQIGAGTVDGGRRLENDFANQGEPAPPSYYNNAYDEGRPKH